MTAYTKERLDAWAKLKAAPQMDETARDNLLLELRQWRGEWNHTLKGMSSEGRKEMEEQYAAEVAQVDAAIAEIATQ